MKRQGTLIRWEKDRGFGFIRSPDIPADVFVHLRDFTDRGAAPQVGMRLSFEEIHVGGKGPRAVAVQADGANRQAGAPERSQMPMQKQAPMQRGPAPARPQAERQNGRTRGAARGAPRVPSPSALSRHSHATPPSSRPHSAALPMAVLIPAYGALLGYGIWTARLPLVALAVLVVLNLLTFFAYGLDKGAAEAGRRRTPENTLHMLSLVGGWPGAWCAQRMFRHKNRKAGFMTVYWGTVLVHVIAVGAWIGKVLPAGMLGR